jgi:hypothetical protein
MDYSSKLSKILNEIKNIKSDVELSSLKYFKDDNLMWHHALLIEHLNLVEKHLNCAITKAEIFEEK